MIIMNKNANEKWNHSNNDSSTSRHLGESLSHFHNALMTYQYENCTSVHTSQFDQFLVWCYIMKLPYHGVKKKNRQRR